MNASSHTAKPAATARAASLRRRRHRPVDGVLGVLLLVAGPCVLAQGATPRVFVWEASLQGDAEVDLRWPVAVAAASADEIAVADAHGPRLVVFARAASLWERRTVLELDAPPRALAHDGERYLLALRGAGQLLALEGERLLQRPVALPEGAVPGAVAARPEGGFLVHDVARERVLAIPRRGGAAELGPLSAAAVALAALPGGGWLAAFPRAGEVRRFDAQGGEIERWAVPDLAPVPAWPTGVATAQRGGEVVVVDRHAARLLALDSGGRLLGIGSGRGWDVGLLRFPAGVARVGEGRYAVVDQDNGRVQIFRRVEDEGSP